AAVAAGALVEKSVAVDQALCVRLGVVRVRAHDVESVSGRSGVAGEAASVGAREQHRRRQHRGECEASHGWIDTTARCLIHESKKTRRLMRVMSRRTTCSR